MSRTTLIAAALASAVVAWLIAPQFFTEFASVRQKIVRTALPATGEELRVPVPPDAKLDQLRSPFAAIGRLRNDTTGPLVIHMAMDGQELCAADIAPGKSQRLNCTVRGPWSGQEAHVLTFSAPSSGFTVEYFELATHYGALSTGPRNVIVVAKGFGAFQKSSAWHAALVFVLLTLSVWSLRDRDLSPVLRITHLVVTTSVVGLMTAVVVTRFVSPYSAVISATFLERLLLLTALPAFRGAAVWLVPVRSRTRMLPLAQAAGIGVVVGCVFLSFAAHRVAERYAGNVSGLVVIAHRFFDNSPMANDTDVRQSLFVENGGGYDGQFFYFMTFDPFLTVFRDQPQRYAAFIDMPPYRYGRIGFSLLTKALSGDRPTLYPLTMVAVVLGALALCGALLALVARHHGLSTWYGVLIVCVPGFWQSAGQALPEPLAAACFLAAYLCLVNQRWLATGVLLGMAMLVHETTGAFVLATAAGLAVTGRRREGVIVALLAFTPIALWKMFLGWLFWSDFGMAGVLPHPNDVGLPFAGVWHLWTTVARGEYFAGWPPITRAAVIFPILTTAGAALAVMSAVSRTSAMAAAALFYGALTITFNYESVWLDVANAERLSIHLFVALAVVAMQLTPGRPWLRRTFAVFWCAAACYVFFGTFDASINRDAVLGMIF